jgi:hypothetical protein
MYLTRCDDDALSIAETAFGLATMDEALILPLLGKVHFDVLLKSTSALRLSSFRITVYIYGP